MLCYAILKTTSAYRGVRKKPIKILRKLSLPLICNVNITSSKQNIKNQVLIIVYAMLWYAMTNENL